MGGLVGGLVFGLGGCGEVGMCVGTRSCSSTCSLWIATYALNYAYINAMSLYCGVP